MAKDKKAVVVVDMLNDFITGALGFDRGRATVEPIGRLLAAARARGICVIYTNDAHLPGLDKELELWGAHALAGTAGAQVIPELAPQAGDFIVPKRRYSGFFQTGLQLLLEELEVGDIILTGVHTHMCVQHTAADAFNWGYRLEVPLECTNAFTEENYQSGLKYLKEVYGARLACLEEILASF